MTIDNIFGQEKNVHLNRRNYDINKEERAYFVKESYSYLNCTSSREFPSYEIPHRLTEYEICAMNSMKGKRKILNAEETKERDKRCKLSDYIF